MHRVAPWLDLALKAALLLLLVGATLRPDLAPAAKEDMPWRAVFYPLAIVFVPLVWAVVGRRRKIAYPFVADALLMLPLLIDTVAGVLGTYDVIEQWDDVVHFAGGLILATALGQLLLPERLGRPLTASLCTGWSAVAVILWELAQYVTLQKDSPNPAALYLDTLSDMAAGLTGALLGAVLTITLLWPLPVAERAAPRADRGQPARQK
jgi:hypothetical protein